MPRRGRAKVMVVVPPLPKGQNADESVVLALVLRVLERLSAPQVADGVHAPCDVVIQEQPHHRRPDEGVPAETERREQAAKEPEVACFVDEPCGGRVRHLARLRCDLGRLATKEPANMGVETLQQTLKRPPHETGSMRRMKIMIGIAV